MSQVLYQVKLDAERLLRIISAEPPNDYEWSGPGNAAWRGTIKHASMLLTRSLAELRKTSPSDWGDTDND